MKKIISFLFALVMFMTVANAQTVENKGVFSQMYIGISGGANYAPLKDLTNFDVKNIGYNAAIELGKNVTPITGFSLQGVMKPDFTNGFEVKRVEVFGNTKFNLMNLFGGYKGYPRRFEIQTVTGIGLNHNFNDSNPNDLSLQAGLEFDFNLGKYRNWYITFSPMVQADNILRAQHIKPLVEKADVKANIGIAYRFGRGGKSHNFALCPYTYTEDQYAELYKKYDECMSRPVQIDTVVIEKVVEVEKNYATANDNSGLNFVPFTKGSAEIDGLGREMLDYIVHNMPKDAVIEVIGSADSGTGTLELNQQLALDRANVVANVLKNNGFNSVSVSSVLDKFETPEMSRCAVIVKRK